MSSAYPGLDY